MLLTKGTCCFHVIDPQEKLMNHIHEGARLVATIEMLVESAKILGVPLVANTQYRKGLGDYPDSLAQKMEEVELIDKVEFNCLASRDTSMYYDNFLSNIKASVVMGVETHICVYQTACGLLQRGIIPWIITDAVGTRNPSDNKVGLKRLESIGCAVVTAEMVIYMLLEKAGTDEFKKILPLITGRS